MKTQLPEKLHANFGEKYAVDPIAHTINQLIEYLKEREEPATDVLNYLTSSIIEAYEAGNAAPAEAEEKLAKITKVLGE